jgi:hypothetical protein
MLHEFLAILVLAGTIAGPAYSQTIIESEDPDLDGVPGIAEPPAEPFAPAPSILVGTGSLLVDRSHGNNFPVDGFTGYLASQGWTIAQHTSGPITGAVLAGYDVLMVPTRDSALPILPFSTAEVSAIIAFLASGNGLWTLSDIVNPSGVNTLSEAFGVHFYADIITDSTDNEGQLFWPRIHQLSPHPVFHGVKSYGYYAGDCLSVTSPAEILGSADADAFSQFCPRGTMPPVLAGYQNTGRAIFAGDITTLAPEYFPSRLRPEEQMLLMNIANWLLGQPPTATSSESWGTIKAMYVDEQP